MDVKLVLPEEIGFTGRRPNGGHSRWHVTDSGLDNLGEKWRVSTVFLAIDHSGYIFETLVDLGDHSDVAGRYRTRVEAIHGHRFYVGLVTFMVKHNAYPVEIRDDEGDRLYYGADGEEEVVPEYDQFWNMHELYVGTEAPKSTCSTITICCGAQVTHETQTGQFHSGSFEEAPPPRCSKCRGEISSVYFGTFHTEEGV